MRVSCPPNSRTTYYIYYSAVTPKPDEKWPAELPARLVRPGKYRHGLDVSIEQVERPLNVEISRGTEIPELKVTTFLAGAVEARLTTPGGESFKRWPIGTSKGSFQAKTDLTLPESAEAGVWQTVISVKRGDINTVAESYTPFIHGSAMWWANNADTLDPVRRGPRAGTDSIEIAAAQNERESFQLAIGSRSGLRDVVLTASDLKHGDTDDIVSAEGFRFQFVEQVHIAMPHPRGAPPGWYGDPLVPWRKRDVAAGGFAQAWVTVQVDRNTPPGDYWGEVTATCAQGKQLVLPVRMRVFDFQLPEDLSMQAVLGGDIWMKATKGYHPRSPRRNPYRDIHDGKTALALARLLADHHATPFYYHHDKCPYAVPWHYDPETGSAEFDFSQLDRNAAIMLDEWGQDYLFFGGKFAAGWAKPGKVYDWHPEVDQARHKLWEEAWPQHRFSRDTPEGKRMYEAYCRGIGRHLDEKGWVDRAVVYVTDEDKDDQIRQVALEIAALIKQAHPRLKSLVLSNAQHRYADYLDEIDYFGGQMTPEHLRRFRESGGQWWGAYNSAGFPTTPLAYTRVLGAPIGSTAAPHWSIGPSGDTPTHSSISIGTPAHRQMPATTPEFS